MSLEYYWRYGKLFVTINSLGKTKMFEECPYAKAGVPRAVLSI
jgi:hypothetical protein